MLLQEIFKLRFVPGVGGTCFLPACSLELFGLILLDIKHLKMRGKTVTIRALEFSGLR